MKKTALAILLVGVCSLPSYAAEGRLDKYENIEDIPYTLLRGLESKPYRETYISQILESARRSGRSPARIDKEDLRQEVLRSIHELRQGQVLNTLRYDVNFDGQVSEDEIRKSFDLKKRRNEDRPDQNDQINRMVSEVMARDLDQDRIITMKEMSTIDGTSYGIDFMISSDEDIDKISPDEVGSLVLRQNNLVGFLDMDPNNDGVLTINELENLANKSYATLDKNADNMLSDDEVAGLRDLSRDLAQISEIKLRCKVPQPETSSKIAILSTYDGAYLSTLSAGDLDVKTGAVKIRITPGKDKIYLFLSSYEAMIWDISGDTSRIDKVMVSARQRGRGSRVALSAVKGLDKEKIKFIDGMCLPRSDDRSPETWEQKLSRNTKLLVSRKPDFFKEVYNAYEVEIGDNNFNLKDLPENPPSLPNGYAEILSKDILSYAPAGILEIENKDIVSALPVKEYDVMPGPAGLAQLLYQNKIEALPRSNKAIRLNKRGGGVDMIVIEGKGSDTIHVPQGMGIEQVTGTDSYKIIKPIPRFPADLNGGHAVRFTLVEGLPMPAGSPGHSCVKYENKSEPENRGGLCN